MNHHSPNHLKLFGLPQFVESEDTKLIRLSNPTLLLIYIANKGDWVSRSELAFLFRPDDDESTALKQIRLLIYRAKKIDWAVDLESDRTRVRLNVATDTQVFKEARAKQNWAEACQAYTAPFLGDYSSPDLSTYNAWLELERSDLEDSYKDALIKYLSALECQGSYEGAVQVASELFKLDRFNEDVLQLYIRLIYLAGRRDKAISVYDDFCKELQQEYDVLPLEATQQLIDDIRNNKDLDAKTITQESISPQLTKNNNLPAQSTHFVGRSSDLTALSQQLFDPKCRLISIIGLGGMGKTRLALSVGSQAIGSQAMGTQALGSQKETSFKDGVFYVELASLDRPEALITHVAQALGLTLAPQQEPLEQIKTYLSDKNILLILDNFEHLLDAAPVVTELLESSPKLKVLVTSRERLNIQSEWLYDLEGLNYPEDNQQDLNVEDFDSIQLFINSAKRVSPRLELTQDDLSEVAAICTQLEGSPLAIELAASWVRIMPVARIRQELSESFELLDSEHSDVAPRHKNMKALWEQTWAQLSEKKRETLAKFTLFRGGCTLEAAEAVTGTHFSVLLSLVNESLLKRIPPNRFDMHELLKQFAKTKLTDSLNETQTKHATTYTDLAAENSPRNAKGKLTTNFLDNLEIDLANLQAAWWHYIEKQDFENLGVLQSALGYMFFTTARYKESIVFYNDSLERLKLQEAGSENRIFRSTLHSMLADALMPLGDWENAQASLKQGLELLEVEGDKAKVQRANLLESSSRIHYFKGQFEDAKTKMLEVYELVKETDNTHLKSSTLLGLAIVLKQLGDYETAESYYYQALEGYKTIDDKHNSSLTLNNLAALKMALGDLDAAQELLQEALEICPSRNGETTITYTIAATHYKQKNYSEAEENFLKALSFAREVNDNTLIAKICLELSKAEIRLEHFEQAKQHLLEGVELARALSSQFQDLELMLAFSQYSVATGKAEQSIPFLKQLLENPSVQSYSLDEAQELKEQLPEHLLQELDQQVVEEELEPLMAQLLETLSNHQ